MTITNLAIQLISVECRNIPDYWLFHIRMELSGSLRRVVAGSIWCEDHSIALRSKNMLESI